MRKSRVSPLGKQSLREPWLKQNKGSPIMMQLQSSQSSSPSSRESKSWDAIKRFKLENIKIKDKITEESKITSNDDQHQTERVVQIQVKASEWIRQIKTEQERQNLLRRELSRVRESLRECQSTREEQNNAEDEHFQMSVAVEQRLEKFLMKNNEIVASISRLKEEMRISRTERALFDNVFKGLEREMKEKEESIKEQVFDNIISSFDYQKHQELTEMLLQLMEKEATCFKQEHEFILAQLGCTQDEIDSLNDSFCGEDDDDEDDEGNDGKGSHAKSNSHDHDDNDSSESGDSSQSSIVCITEDPNEDGEHPKIATYEQFQSQKKNILAKQHSDKVECARMSEVLRRFLASVTSDSLDSFLNSFANIEANVEELFMQNDALMVSIRNAEDEIVATERHIEGLAGKKEQLLKSLECKNVTKIATVSEREKIVSSIAEKNAQLNALDDASVNIESDLNRFAKHIPGFLEDFNIVNEEFLRENIHMNVHANNVLSYFGVIEKKVDITNSIYERLRQKEIEAAHHSLGRGSACNLSMQGIGGGVGSAKLLDTKKFNKNSNKFITKKKIEQSHLFSNPSGVNLASLHDTILSSGQLQQQQQSQQQQQQPTHLPYNFARLKQRENNGKQIHDYLDRMVEEKEADSFMHRTNFAELGRSELLKMTLQTDKQLDGNGSSQDDGNDHRNQGNGKDGGVKKSTEYILRRNGLKHH